MISIWVISINLNLWSRWFVVHSLSIFLFPFFVLLFFFSSIFSMYCFLLFVLGPPALMSHRAFLAARLLWVLCIANCVTIQANKDVLFCSVARLYSLWGDIMRVSCCLVYRCWGHIQRIRLRYLPVEAYTSLYFIWMRLLNKLYYSIRNDC